MNNKDNWNQPKMELIMLVVSLTLFAFAIYGYAIQLI